MNNQTFSGIEVLGDMSWGTHFCQFYETKQDLLEILVPYFKIGLQKNEFCLWIASDPIDVKEAAIALKKTVPELDRYIADQKIEILSHETWYLKKGKFNPKRVFKGWNAKLNQALEKDFAGMRVSGNVGWIDQGLSYDFIEYERGMDHFLAEKRIVVLCTYPLQKCNASDVLNVAHVHECAISKRKGQWEIIEVPAAKKTKAQIQKVNDELEQRVVERTTQLERANEELKYEIAERRKSEDELHLAYQRLSYHVENTPLAVVEFDKDLFIKRWSKRAEEIFGWKVSEALGKNVYDADFPIIYNEDMLSVDTINEELTKGIVNRNVSLNRNYTKDRNIIYNEWYNSVLRDEHGKVITILSLVHNVTERKKTEKELLQLNGQLRNLSSHLQNIQEDERTAIAREIHDELGQQLTALKMEVGWLNKKLPEDFALKEKGNEILSIVSEMLKTVKRIASDLRPNILDELGLIAALEWQGQECEKHTGIKFQFQTAQTDFNFERTLSTNIFRVHQEALTNIVRHAETTRIETALEKKDGWLLLIIKDHGKGFDVDEEKNKNSLGLIGMKERALMLHGELVIESVKRKGTVITLKVPLLRNR
jgi:PAS domain S-box-containing protein